MERVKRTLNEKKKILEKSNYMCSHCGVKLDETTMTIEHVYPLYKGGEDDLKNIVALCEKCNIKKADFIYSPSDFYYYLSPEETNNLEEYIEEISYPLGYPLGNITRILYGINESSYNIISKEKDREKRYLLKNKCTTKLAIEQAFPGDTREILNFVVKARNYSRKQRDGKNFYRFEPANKWLAEKAIENCIKYDKLYMITSPVTKEYYGYVMFNRFKDMEIVEDFDHVYSYIKKGFFLTASSFYKIPGLFYTIIKTLGYYGKVNNTYVPILEFSNAQDYAALTETNSYLNDKYSIIRLGYKNTTDPVPKECEDSPYPNYENMIMFVRIPKAYLYGQPMSINMYEDVVKDVLSSKLSGIR